MWVRVEALSYTKRKGKETVGKINTNVNFSSVVENENNEQEMASNGVFCPHCAGWCGRLCKDEDSRWR